MRDLSTQKRRFIASGGGTIDRPLTQKFSFEMSWDYVFATGKCGVFAAASLVLLAVSLFINGYELSATEGIGVDHGRLSSTAGDFKARESRAEDGRDEWHQRKPRTEQYWLSTSQRTLL